MIIFETNFSRKTDPLIIKFDIEGAKELSKIIRKIFIDKEVFEDCQIEIFDKKKKKNLVINIVRLILNDFNNIIELFSDKLVMQSDLDGFSYLIHKLEKCINGTDDLPPEFGEFDIIRNTEIKEVDVYLELIN